MQDNYMGTSATLNFTMKDDSVCRFHVSMDGYPGNIIDTLLLIKTKCIVEPLTWTKFYQIIKKYNFASAIYLKTDPRHFVADTFKVLCNTDIFDMFHKISKYDDIGDGDWGDFQYHIGYRISKIDCSGEDTDWWKGEAPNKKTIINHIWNRNIPLY